MDEYKDLQIELGKRLRHLRKEQGLTQAQLEENSGLNDKYYSEVERGLRNVSLKNIHRIAGGLGITLGELFRFTIDKYQSDEAEEIIAMITRLLQSEDEKKIMQVLNILKELM